MSGPKPGESWRNDMGAIRHVRSVDDDGYSVTYSRPAPAPVDWRTVLMRDWLTWVSSTNAVLTRKAATAEDKDWSYVQ
jgi:hypothetical protein